MRKPAIQADIFPSEKYIPVTNPLRMERTEALKPYERNARTHTDAQVRQIARSIEAFGFVNPIIVDKRLGIAAGHGRLLAARLLGLEVVPVVMHADMTAAQRRAYILADNRLALAAGWDEDLLALELGALRDDGLDLSILGFGADEIGRLLAADLDDAPPGLPAGPVEAAAFRTVRMHFLDQAAVDLFAATVGLDLEAGQSLVWWPEGGDVYDRPSVV